MANAQLLAFVGGVVLVVLGLFLFPRNDGPIKTVREFPRRVRDSAREITIIGDPVFIIAGSFLLAASGAWLGVFSPRAALVLALVPGATLLLVSIAKQSVSLPRPRLGRGTDGSGFPSGHTAGAAVASALFALVVLDAGLAGPSVVVGAAVFTFLVGMSRLLSGVHYAEDVIVGAGFGLVMAAFGSLAL